MGKVIIYVQDGGVPAVITPTAEAIREFGIKNIAEKDTPYGKPFLIMDASDLPDAPQEAWTVSGDQLTSGVGLGPVRWRIKQLRADITAAYDEQAPSRVQPMDYEVFSAQDKFSGVGSVAVAAAYDAHVIGIEETQEKVLAEWEEERAARISALETKISHLEQRL
jgi:hypothetical protein